MCATDMLLIKTTYLLTYLMAIPASLQSLHSIVLKSLEITDSEGQLIIIIFY